ncbi:MgtC/SapB family protein [Roseomonas sp. NAR14]|uniref:Protein MgtC n=1 Tax=Roseomonas acroporae TaxID=2937791 RepID=A0A9X2BXE8_9PROT|nr:MgtC/SapB family protein [Roseomonas acroporae]MCK8787151.1 MgtC/SapB family protein [Roseomonas acroporae]
MALEAGWPEIALRLALALLAGALFGLDRWSQERPAGLRTTILVGLAAAVAMLLANRLLGTVGKAPGSFVNIDVMRLPLGVLSGMGFIGAGAILRQGQHVIGVTTAATLWFVTMVGLCFGAGEIGLGLAALGLGHFAVWALKRVERHMTRIHRFGLVLGLRAGCGPMAGVPTEMQAGLRAAGLRVARESLTLLPNGRLLLRYDIRWRCRAEALARTPEAVAALAARPEVVSLRWYPETMP